MSDSPIPAGKYFSLSSKDISIACCTLQAQCRKDDGTYVPSSLDLNRCIANKNGTLTWAMRGNFGLSAKNVTLDVDGMQLVADCRKENGTYVSSSIYLDEKIWNDNGVLKCTLLVEMFGLLLQVECTDSVNSKTDSEN